MPTFKIVPISVLSSRNFDFSSKLSSCTLEREAMVSISPVEFGVKTRPSSVISEWPQEDWNRDNYKAEPVIAYLLTGDVKVFSELGIIIIDDKYVVEESLHFVFPDHYNWPIEVGADGYNRITIDIPDSFQLLSGNWLHLLAGHTGNRNYAHFWIDCISTLEFRAAIESAYRLPLKMLLPNIRSGYQREVYNSLIGQNENDCRYVLDEVSLVKTESLIFLPSCKRQDYIPRPSYSQFLQRHFIGMIGDAVEEPDSSHGLDEPLYLYVSRKDAPARRLENEESVEELLKSKGFRVILASQLNLHEQIRLFSRACIVVSAHGAGLANLLFMKKDSIIIEIHCSDMVNWSLRRLASSAGLRYGCIIGDVIGDAPTKSFQDKTWKVSLDPLSRAVDDAIQITTSFEREIACQNA